MAKNNAKLPNTSRLTSWNDKHGSLLIPEHIKDVWLTVASVFEREDVRHDRLVTSLIFTFGAQSADLIHLEETDAQWKLLTPFGELVFAKAERTSCNLIESEGNQVFTYKSASSRLYQIPSRK